ncbi:MAG: ribonuclease E/G [Henriciella sp.]|uniref:ribonuclease E/G n=1 Tax=Henriciella sp. TaxID=1968823 RepID=UPI0032EAB909
MSIARILLHEAPGETRAAAFDAVGRPVRLFLERWDGRGEPATLGDVVQARLRQNDPKDGGAFFERTNGERIFVRDELPKGLSEGAETSLEIRAEARHGKLARASLSTKAEPAVDSVFERWFDTLPDDVSEPKKATTPEEFDQIDAAFDEALSIHCGLPKGGLVRLERTSALVAADIDTAGRLQKGSAGARALSTNREAVTTIARQLALRDWGGLIVIDCIGPLTAEARTTLRTEFLKTFQSLSSRKPDALKPSRFGLLEAQIAWGACPIGDRLLDEGGQPTPDTELLDLFRQAEREATANRSAFYRLTLSPHALKAYITRRNECDAILQEAFSGRVTIASGTGERSVVRRA